MAPNFLQNFYVIIVKFMKTANIFDHRNLELYGNKIIFTKVEYLARYSKDLVV